jgi:hypothetical protein
VASTIRFQITMPDGKTFETSYESDSVLIGSGSSAVLRLDDAAVSSIHAVVKVGAEGAITIIDLGSEAGTTVNGVEVTEAVALKSGDLLGIGGVKLVLETGVATGTAVTQTNIAAAPKAHVLASEAEVALATHQRRAHRPRLRHAHQGLVDRAVTVRVILAHHVADDRGALLGLRIWVQMQLVVHRVEDAPLDRLQAVTHVGESTGRDDAERVVQVTALGFGAQRDIEDLLLHRGPRSSITKARRVNRPA